MHQLASPSRSRRRAAARGLSLVELLISLAISALLLTATMVALDASFKAYAMAAEQASTQISTRMIVDRLLTLVRTSTAHGPLLEDPLATPPITRDGNVISSHYIELIDTRGRLLRIEYRAASSELWLIENPGAAGAVSQPLIGGVTDAHFTLRRRLDNDGVWVLERGSVDITIEPEMDNTIAIERASSPPLRVIASTAPRKLEGE